MTKFYCPGCGRNFNLYVNEASTREFTRLWEAEHAKCQSAYRAALALVERIEAPLQHDWGVWVCGQSCQTLDEAVGVLLGLQNG